MAVATRKISPKSQPKAAAAGEKSFANLIELRENGVLTGWLVKVFVSTVQLRTLVGRKVTGIAPHPKGGGRSVPTYDVPTTGWLDKWFAFVVPAEEGVYDLSARATEVNDADEVSVHIESTQVIVTCDDDGVFSISRMGYGEMVEHFGGVRLTKGSNGDLTPMSESAEIESF